MLFYALAIIQHIQSLPELVKLAWYAHDASACGEIQDLYIW